MNDEFEDTFYHDDISLSEDGQALMIKNPIRIQQILNLLRRAAEHSPSEKLAYATLWQGEDPLLGSDFNPDGIEDALQHLGCFD